MNDGIVRDVQWMPWWLFLSNAPLPLLSPFRATIPDTGLSVVRFPFTRHTCTQACTHACICIFAPLTPTTPATASETSSFVFSPPPSVCSPLLPSSGLSYSQCVCRRVQSTRRESPVKTFFSLFFYLFSQEGNLSNYNFCVYTKIYNTMQFLLGELVVAAWIK